MRYSTTILTGFLLALRMGIVGLMTLRNLRQFRVQPASSDSGIIQLSSKYRQIAIMLLFEIVISLVFSTGGSILYAYTQRIPNELKTMEQQALDYFLLDFDSGLVFIQTSINSY
ncbi:unnamed protein product [Rotaria magnacalcarata]|uniref:Uncharacterized protein n=1 Tax=Rotaria magnacalcarata TaxID=392030 RepID=A0A820GLS3_9BILA|nr:unnamed protein product [Rotaria magnacalcarata]CAF4277412.1 unnamed protein product [Rotaria magnacalcarata]CAF4381748.1 unnamed protein product [Rotaria magnacalcarata]